MSLRKFTESETQTTQERVAKHRERLKALGVKRLDLSITPEAFGSLKSWSENNGLSYSEAAEQLFLAASAPISSYIPTAQSALAATNEAQKTEQRSKSRRQAVTDTSAVAAFFANRKSAAE